MVAASADWRFFHCFTPSIVSSNQRSIAIRLASLAPVLRYSHGRSTYRASCFTSLRLASDRPPSSFSHPPATVSAVNGLPIASVSTPAFGVHRFKPPASFSSRSTVGFATSLSTSGVGPQPLLPILADTSDFGGPPASDYKRSFRSLRLPTQPVVTSRPSSHLTSWAFSPHFSKPFSLL